MISLSLFKDAISNLYLDPDKEDNWTSVEELLRNKAEIEDVQGVKDEILSFISRFERHDAWEYVVRLMRMVVEIEDDPAKQADLYFRLGKIYDEKIFDSKMARRYFEETLRVRQGDQGAEEALSQIKALAGNWRDVVERYLQEAKDMEDQKVRSELLFQVAATYQKFGGKSKEKIKDVLHYLQLALESDAGNKQAVRFLRRLLVERKQWDEVVALYKRLAEVAKSKEEVVEALIEQARILSLRLNRNEEAAAIYEHILDIDSGNTTAMAFLVNFYTETGNSDKLIQLYQNVLKLRPNREDELAALLQIAMVYWRVKNDFEKAEEYFRRVKKIIPDHPASLNFYREFYSRTQDWIKLVQILTETARTVKEPSDAVRIWKEIAEISLNQLQNVERAIDAYKAILKIDPENLEVLTELKKLYRKTEKWNALLDILKGELGAQDRDVSSKIAILKEMAEIYKEKLSLDAMVIKTYHQILSLDPADYHTVLKLAEIYEHGEKWSDLAALYEKAVAVEEDNEKKAQWLRKVADIWMGKLQNFNRATAPLEKILELEPNNLEVIETLKNIYTQRRMWEPLYRILKKEEESIPPDKKLEHLREMASIAWTKLGLIEEAVSIFWKILELSPADREVLSNLEKLCERIKDWEGLAKVLKMRSEIEESPDEKAALLQKLAGLFMEKLEKIDEAKSAWHELLMVKPGHPKAMASLRELYIRNNEWENLEQLFSLTGNWNGLAESFVTAAEQKEDKNSSVELFFKAADIYEQKVGAPSKAARVYEKILAIDPQNTRAAELLLPICRKEGNTRKEVELQTTLLQSAKTDEEKLLRLRRIVEIYGEEIGSLNEAFKMALQAHEIAPTESWVLDAIEKYGEKISAWDDLQQVYRKRSEIFKGDDRIPNLEKLALVLHKKLGKLEEALKVYEEIIEINPTNAQGIVAIEEILKTTGKLESLLRFYEKRLENIGDENEKVEMLYKMAMVAQEGLDNPQIAADYYERILKIKPHDRRSMEELETLYRISEKWENLINILEQKSKTVSGEELADVITEIAEVNAINLGNYEKAIDEAQKVLEMKPADRRIVGLLEKMLSKEDYRVEVARILMQHLKPLEKYSQYAWVIQILLEAGEEKGEKRLSLFESLVDVYDRNLNDQFVAYETIVKALDEFPMSQDLWKKLIDVAGRTGRIKEGVAVLERIFEDKKSPDEGKMLLATELAVISEEKLGDVEKAQKYYRWIFEKDPFNQTAFDALEVIYTNLERFEDLKSLYREKAEKSENVQEKVELLQKIGFIDEDMLENRRNAISTYREILSLMPQNTNARKTLERLYEQESMWEELADLLEENINWTPPENLVGLQFKLADVLDRKLSKYDRAVYFYREVLDKHPTHLKAQEGLERFLDIPEVCMDAAIILEPLYESQGAYSQLQKVLEVKYKGATNDEEKIQVLSKIADLKEKRLRDFDGAFESYSKAFRMDPSREELMRKLEDLVEEQNFWDRYAKVLEEVVIKIEDSILKGSIIFRIGEIYDSKLSNTEKAKEFYRKFIELEVEDREKILSSAKALEKIYIVEEDYNKLAEILNLQFRYTEDLNLKYLICKRIAEIQEVHIGNFGEAINTNLKILEIKPDDLESINSLRRLYEITENWSEFVSITKKLIDITEENARKKELMYEVAAIYTDKLKDNDEAIFTYQLIDETFGNEIPALERLLKLYEQIEDYPELIATIDRLINIKTEKSDKVQLLIHAGRVEKEKLEDINSAVERFRNVLEMDSENREALTELEGLLGNENIRLQVAKILEPIYQQTQNLEKLLGVLDIEIAEEENPDLKTQILKKAAEIAEIGLGDLPRAFGYYSDALKMKLGSAQEAIPLMEELERIARDSGNMKRLTDFYILIAPDIFNSDVQLRVYTTIAEIFHRELKDIDSAKDWYTKLLDIAPQNMEAISALEEIYSQKQDYSRLIEILKMRSDLTEDPTEKVDLFFKQAKIAMEKLRDEAVAISCYEAILEFEESREAVRALEDLYRSTGRWGNYRDILLRQLEWPEVDAVELHYRLGVVLNEHLGDTEGALEHFKEALKIRQDHFPTIEMLENLLKGSTFRGEIPDILEPIYLKNLQFQKLLDIFEVKLESVNDPMGRKEIFLRMGKIYEEQLEDLEKAFNIYVRLLEEDIESKEARQNIDRLANVLDIWPKAAEAYKRILSDVVSDTSATADLWYHLAIIQDTQCDDSESAIESLKKVLTYDPQDRRAFTALESIYRRDDRWAKDLYNLYRENVDMVSDPAERKRMLYTMGKICEEKLSQPQEAIQIWKEVYAEDPRDETAIAALDRLYYYEKKFSDLADLLLERIDRAENAMEQIELKHKLARIYSENLGDIDAAIELYEQILNQDSAYQDSILALEDLMNNPDKERRVSEILVPIYKEHKNWQKLVKCYEVQLKSLTDPFERKERFIEIGNIQEEKIGNLNSAFSAFASALKEDPSDIQIVEKLMKIAEKLENWEELASVFGEAAQLAESASARGFLLRSEGRILDRKVGDIRKAVEVYRMLLEIEEGDSEAIETLDSLYTLLSDWEGLMEILDMKAEFASDAGTQIMTRLRQGEICEEQIGDLSRAIKYYRMVLAIEPSNFTAFESLERLYESLEEWEELASLLKDKVAYISDRIEKRNTTLRIAQIQKDKLGNMDEAILSYNLVLEEFPEDIETRKILDNLYLQTRRWEEYLENLEKRASLTFDEEELAGIMLCMGDVLVKEIKDVDRAIEYYKKVLEIRDDEKASSALEEIAQNEDYRQTVISILEPVYRRGGKWEKLLGLYRMSLEILSDPVQRVQTFIRMAQLQEQGMGDRQGAFETYLQALKEDIWDQEVYRKAEILAEDLGKFADFAEGIEEKINSVFDVSLITELSLLLGKLWEEKVGNVEKAINSYRRVLEQGVEAESALDNLDRLYTSTQRWEDLVGILERKIPLQSDDAKKAQIMLRMAEIKIDKTGQIEDAIQVLGSVLEIDNQNMEAIRMLEGLLDRGEMESKVIEILEDAYRSTGNMRKLVDLLDLKARRTVDPIEKVEILKAEAKIAEEDLKDPDTAMRSLMRAIMESPNDPILLDELERLSELLGTWDFVSSGLEKIIEGRNPSEDTKKDMSLRIARWAKNKTRDHSKAVRWYEVYLDFDPENTQIIDELEEELLAIKDYPKLLTLLEKHESIEYDLTKKKELLYSIAEIALKETGEKDRAIKAYEKLYEIEETNTDVIDSLISLKWEKEDWKAVMELLERRIDSSADVREATDLRFKLAGLVVEVEKDDERAIEIFRQILEYDPQNQDAQKWLEHLYEKNEKWYDLKEIYLDRAQNLPAVQEKLQYYLLLAHLEEEKLDDRDGAIEALMKAFDMVPDSPEVISNLERLLSATERLDDLIEILKKRAAKLAEIDPHAQMGLMVRIGEIYFKSLGKVDEAVRCYEEVLEKDPENPSALLGLAAIYESQGEWLKCISALDRAATAMKDFEEMGNIFFRIGMMKKEKLLDLSGALEAFNAVLEVYPDHPKVMDTLEEIFETQGDWKRYAGILEVKLSRTSSDEEKVKLLMRLKDIASSKMNDMKRSINYLEQALAIKPADSLIRKSLIDAYIAIGNNDAACKMIEELIKEEERKGVKRSKDLSSYMCMLGRVDEQRGNLQDALKRYEEAIKMDPANVLANFSLGAIYEKTGEIEKGMKSLRPLLLQNLEGTGVDKAEVYYLLGKMHSAKGEKSKAINMFDRGLSINPAHKEMKSLLEELKKK